MRNMNYKALILAAGMGTRLAPLTDEMPKSLVRVNGKPILFKQIENLFENGIQDITIVSGYKATMLESVVKEYFPNIKIVESVDYMSTNNMYSAYLGIKDMFPNGCFSPFFMMNADVFFDSSILAEMKRHKGNLIAVDMGRYLEESMKVVEQDGRLTSISKQIPQEAALGCSIDVYKFESDGAEMFFNKCAMYIEEKKEMKKWSEVALNDTLAEVEFKACPLSGRWFEIDNHDDLVSAEILFSN